MALCVKSFTGNDAFQFKNDLAKLRIKVFREFPYLYDGSLAYEEKYLESFISSENSVIAIAFDSDKVVGASTGIPLESEPPDIQKPWLENHHDIGKIFYFSESVLLPEYRGMGIGVKFFEEREAWVRKLNKFNLLAFCAIARNEGHPHQPAGYKPLNEFWEKRGFAKLDNYFCHLSWKEIDEEQESKKALQFWCKEI